MAAFLNQLALSFDLPILDWIQANLQSPLMDKIMPIITLFGEGGVFWIAWAVLMLILPKTRKIGISMLFAIFRAFFTIRLTRSCGDVTVMIPSTGIDWKTVSGTSPVPGGISTKR